MLQLGGGSRSANPAPSDNQRRAGRVNCEGIMTSWGEILNASASGLRISARGKALPEIGEVAMITICGPEGPFEVTAKAVWIKHRNWGKREIGVQFVDVPEQARWHLARLAEAASRATLLDTVTSNGFADFPEP
ncbi:MAG: PilZ domain-containing protein [Phycisphaerae bacterium]|nr:PilZ domain-containing protein [Phycisphaerae bacterium]